MKDIIPVGDCVYKAYGSEVRDMPDDVSCPARRLKRILAGIAGWNNQTRTRNEECQQLEMAGSEQKASQ